MAGVRMADGMSADGRAGAFAAGPAGNFAEMLDVERYGSRSGLFDAIIADSDSHFWDPMDPAYIDYSLPFDQQAGSILPLDVVPELASAVADRLDAGQRIAFANESCRWWLSSVLHGEQGALSLSANLCQALRNPGAIEYAANQAREEARHVTAFTRYIAVRWGEPLPASGTLSRLLAELVSVPEIYKKIVGMQLLVEGLAMGIFATLHAKSHDPLLVRLTQLVMTDEAFHHRAGKLWADDVLPAMTRAEHDAVEDWAAECFQVLMFNMLHPRQKKVIYARFGLDWEWVRDAMKESYTSADRRRELMESTNIFRVLIKTLLKGGVITARTRAIYAAWVDMKDLAAEGDAMVGDPIAAAGLAYLREVNEHRPRRIRKVQD